MRLRLIPGLLSEQRIECDDAHHRLLVNLHLVHLSTIQYTLVAALLRQRQRWQEDTQEQEPLVVSVQHLQQVARLPSGTLVKNHLSLASGRLASAGLLIVNLRGYGYGIFGASEVLSPSVPLPADD